MNKPYEQDSSTPAKAVNPNMPAKDSPQQPKDGNKPAYLPGADKEGTKAPLTAGNDTR